MGLAGEGGTGEFLAWDGRGVSITTAMTSECLERIEGG